MVDTVDIFIAKDGRMTDMCIECTRDMTRAKQRQRSSKHRSLAGTKPRKRFFCFAEGLPERDSKRRAIKHNKTEMMGRLRVLVCGQGRHGKDTACEWLRDSFGLRFTSSSMFACEKVIFPTMQAMYGYKTCDECYSDRHNHRGEWFDMIREYTRHEPSRLVGEILTEHDVYCGMRSIEELEASRTLFNIIIWIDASKRVGTTEGASSCEITRDMCDVVIDNNSDDPNEMFTQLDFLFKSFT
jgi:hypothetical protein